MWTGCYLFERVAGIEPASKRWKRLILAVIRYSHVQHILKPLQTSRFVEGVVATPELIATLLQGRLI